MGQVERGKMKDYEAGLLVGEYSGVMHGVEGHNKSGEGIKDEI